jgi:hypothetical protein
VATDLLNEVDGASDVGVHNPHHLVEVLVEEALAEAPARVRKQGIDRSPPDLLAQPVDTFDGCKVSVDGLDPLLPSPRNLWPRC